MSGLTKEIVCLQLSEVRGNVNGVIVVRLRSLGERGNGITGQGVGYSILGAWTETNGAGKLIHLLSKIIERFVVRDAELLDRFVVCEHREMIEAEIRAEVVDGPHNGRELKKESRAVFLMGAECAAGVSNDAVVAINVLHKDCAEASRMGVIARGSVARERERKVHAGKGDYRALNQGLAQDFESERGLRRKGPRVVLR